MQVRFEQLLLELLGAWRYRWYALGLAWAIGLGSWVVIMLMPNSYESKARVYVDAETVLKPLLSGLAVNTDLTNRVHMMSAVLMSRPNIERVAHETNLYLRATTAEDLERLLAGLSNKVLLTGGGDNTYTIAYRDPDPEMAHRVVRQFLDTFVEDTIGAKREDSAGARRFLEEQIRDLEQKLRVAEDRLADFKKQNVGLMPGERGDYYTRLQSAIAAFEDLQTKVRVAADKRSEIQRQLEGEEPTFGLAPIRPTGPNDALLAQYRTQLENLLLQYTERHPQVIALRETIAKLEEDNNKALAAGVHAPLQSMDPSTIALRQLDINPVYQSMKIVLSQTELELVELQKKLSEQRTLVSELRSKVDLIPVVEAQLVRLNRDYEVNRAQHTALMQRLESARLSDQAEQSSEHVKFRVIDPPVMPLQPVAPNRGMLLSLALLVALGAGGGLAVLLHQLNAVFATRTALLDATGIPVLGAITLVISPREQRAARLQPVYYAAAVTLLILIYAASIMLSGSGAGLAQFMAG